MIRERRAHGHFVLLLSVCSLACGRIGFEPADERDRVEAVDTGPTGSMALDGSITAPRDGAPTEPLARDAAGSFTSDAGVDASHGSDAGVADASGASDVDASSMQPPDPLDAYLVHRYTFDGTGTSAVDGAGSAGGTLVGTTLDGTGSVSLAGGLSGPHVALPAGLISSLQSVSVEAWLTWNGGGGYQRVFDFGNSTGGAGAQGAGTRHFSLALNAGGDSLRLVFDVDPTTGSDNWRSIFSAPIITTGQIHQIVAVFDRGANEIRLYVDGARRQAAAVPATEALAQIDDVNNWLGMAQWAADPNLNGVLHDVRLYQVPLSDADVSRRFQTGYE